MRRPIKAHLVNRPNRPVYCSKPVTHATLNFDLNSNQSVKRSNRPVYRYEPVELSFFKFKFEFDLYRPVSDQTGPVYRYRIPAVWPIRSVNETLGVVEGVRQLGARPLWRAEDVAPLLTDVADDDVPGVLQLPALAGLEGDGGALEPEGLEQELLVAGVPRGGEVPGAVLVGARATKSPGAQRSNRKPTGQCATVESSIPCSAPASVVRSSVAGAQICRSSCACERRL